MDNLARQQTPQHLYQEYARVIKATGRQCHVQTTDGVYEARQAVSCLLTPQTGDQVLVAIHSTGDAWVLAILEREDSSVHHIELQGDVRLRVRQGRLKIASQEGMDLASARDIRTMSEDMTINAVKGRVSIQDGFYQGGFLRAQISRITWLADSVESVMERLTQRVKRLYRTVDEFEQVKAGRVDYLVKKLLSFRSRYTVMASKEDIKVDGERIHIG